MIQEIFLSTLVKVIKCDYLHEDRLGMHKVKKLLLFNLNFLYYYYFLPCQSVALNKSIGTFFMNKAKSWTRNSNLRAID